MIYAELHPEAKHGVDRRSDQVANSGDLIYRMRVRRHRKARAIDTSAAPRAGALGDDFGAVTGTSLDGR